MKNLFGQNTKDYYQGDVTNSLTQSVIKYINLRGGVAFRVNTSGIPIIIGGIFNGWRKSTNPGAADVRAIVDGLSIDIEVKSDHDQLNTNQKIFKDRILSAKGQYWEIRSFDDFINHWDYFIKKIGNGTAGY